MREAAEIMADSRLETARNLLLRAVESLGGPGTSRTDSSTGGQTTPGGGVPPRGVSRTGPERGHLADVEAPVREESREAIASSSGPPPVRVESVLRERNRLFNFGFRRRETVTGKRPRKATGAVEKSKKKKLNMWSHDFVCLASTTAHKPPSSLETADLIRAGLGRKQLALFETDDGCDVHSEIMNAFPRLKDGGGYELLRIGESGQRVLHVIPPLPEGYTVSYLKEVVRNAKIYVRPLQKDLSLNPEPQFVAKSVGLTLMRCKSIEILTFLYCRIVLLKSALSVIERFLYPNFVNTSSVVRGQFKVGRTHKVVILFTPL